MKTTIAGAFVCGAVIGLGLGFHLGEEGEGRRKGAARFSITVAENQVWLLDQVTGETWWFPDLSTVPTMRGFRWWPCERTSREEADEIMRRANEEREKEKKEEERKMREERREYWRRLIRETGETKQPPISKEPTEE